jgi:hypothetical protein
LRLVGAAVVVGIVPVISLADTGEAEGVGVVRGIGTDAEAFGTEPLSDCRPIGVGEVIEGVAGSSVAGLAPSSAGD